MTKGYWYNDIKDIDTVVIIYMYTLDSLQWNCLSAIIAVLACFGFNYRKGTSTKHLAQILQNAPANFLLLISFTFQTFASLITVTTKSTLQFTLEVTSGHFGQILQQRNKNNANRLVYSV